MQGLPRLDPPALRGCGGSAPARLAERPARRHRPPRHRRVPPRPPGRLHRRGGRARGRRLGHPRRRAAAAARRSRRSARRTGCSACSSAGRRRTRVTVISAVRDVLLAPREPDRLSEAIADPGVHVVTLTVTEKGYPRDRATGGLAVDDLEVASDLAGGAPRTAIGQLARGIAPRAGAGRPGPLTVVSCDNLPRNGEVLRRLVRDFCARLERRGRPRAGVARAPRALPEHDGRPRRARHHARRPRGGRAPARPGGPRGGRRRAVPPVGDRGRLRRPAPGVGAGRRADRARRRPARGGQAAAAQRHPLDARLRRRAGRRAHRRRRVGRPGGGGRRRAARRRGPRADAARGAGHRHRRLPRRARAALDQPADRATASSRSAPTARRSCRRASPARARGGSPTARRRAGSRS